jgi:Flp pilus assembly protein TadD
VIKKLKLILFIVFFIYQTSAFSKTTDENDFNPKYLSNYLSAIVSQNNKESDDAVKHFNSSKILINKHEKYLKKYVITLTVNGQVKKSINIIKQNRGQNNTKFFEAKLLLLIDNFKKREFDQNIELLNEFQSYRDYDNFQYIIYEVLKSYNDLFLTRELNLNKKKFGKLSSINEAFQYCYLNQPETNLKFINLINSDEGDYTRYLFFYLNNLIKEKDFKSALRTSREINALDSNLLIQQAKQWIDNSNFNKFDHFFSCENEVDILAEFFFLISNFLAVDENFEKSNFYLNISNYLNPKFYFNLTHLVSNYFEIRNYEKMRSLLENFNKEDEIYHWYKLKKISQIIYNEQNSKQSLNYIETKFNEYSNPSTKIIYDMANIYKRNKEFEKSIKYYSLLLEKLNENSDEYADVLHKRGTSYERVGDDKNSDKDLLKSLSIKPDDPYVLNYLGYSWLERSYKIQEAISMLNKAYNQKKNDPFIIDSVGWGYYLIGEFVNAENFLRKAIQLMPKDPIVNDHYGDVLWKLNRKIQAKYYWQSVLSSEESDNEMKTNVSKKLLKGLDES